MASLRDGSDGAYRVHRHSNLFLRLRAVNVSVKITSGCKQGACVSLRRFAVRQMVWPLTDLDEKPRPHNLLRCGHSLSLTPLSSLDESASDLSSPQWPGWQRHWFARYRFHIACEHEGLFNVVTVGAFK